MGVSGDITKTSHRYPRQVVLLFCPPSHHISYEKLLKKTKSNMMPQLTTVSNSISGDDGCDDHHIRNKGHVNNQS